MINSSPDLNGGKMKVFIPQVLAKLLYESPERTGQTLRKVSRRMGISEAYLSRQLNPEDPGAKLGVEDFVYLTEVTDLAPLKYIAQAFGQVLVPLPNTGNTTKKEWLKHIAKVSKEAGEVVCQLSGALADDDDIGPDEAPAVRREVFEAIQALTALWVELQDI